MWTTWNELSESLPTTHYRQVQQEHSPSSFSAVDFWNRSELELEHSRVADLRPELALMLTKMCCRMNCFICCPSGLRGLVEGLVQVSDVSCVSRDGVRLVPDPCNSSNNEVSERFVGSSLRIVLHHFCPNDVPFSHAVSPLWSPLPDDNPRCSGAMILNETVSATGTISCL